MSRRYAAFYPLTLALLFGLAISFIPVSPALSDNITACQGTGNSAAKVILGGRVITPSTILRTANGQPCAQDEIPINLTSSSSSPIFSRTVIISPVGTPTQNGAALLSARDIISNSNPSSSNPWLLKLEPGNYDLSNQSLTLLPYVDLEGSGENITVISSTISNILSPNPATLIVASNTEARFVTVANYGADNERIAVLIPTGVTNVGFNHFTAIASGSAGSFNYSLLKRSGVTTITNSTFRAIGGSNSVNASFLNEDGPNSITNSTLTALGSIGSANFAFNNQGGASIVTNSTLAILEGQGGTSINNTGIITVTNSILSVNSTHGSIGIFNNNTGTSNVFNSILTASFSPQSYGMVNLGTAKVANSQLSGTSAASTGLTVCPFSYNGNFQPLDPATCV